MAGGTRGESTTIRFFEQPYAIVVGLGLALAIEQVLALGRAGVPVSFEHLPLFLAYINFAFPLAHASVRYLELAYLDRAAGRLGKARVLLDLSLGTGHFLWLLGLSFLIPRPTAFAWAAAALLIGRPWRDLILWFAKRPPLEFDRRVARVHLASIAALLVVLGTSLFTVGTGETWTLRFGTLAASFVFAIGLYLSAFGYFFPSDD